MYVPVVIALLLLMAIPKENTVPTLAISTIDLEVIFMSEEMFNAEKDYGITMAIAKSMLEKGLLTLSEYDQFEEVMLEKYQPKLTPLIATLS